MTHEVFSVTPDTAIETVARLMADRRVSGLPVVENDRTVGVVSLVDLVNPDRVKTDRPADTSAAAYYVMGDGDYVSNRDVTLHVDGVVRDVMTPYVISVERTASLDEAARQMTEYKVHRLLVMDGEKLVGIVSSLDLLAGYTKGE